MDHSSGVITTVAGTGVSGHNGDGLAATSSELFGSGFISFDPSGALLIADTYNGRIRKLENTCSGIGAR